jgi:GTP 3',8-cyclase
MDRFDIDGHKLHLHPDATSKWLSGKGQEVFPIYVEVSPVGHCNHRCTFCAVDYIGYVNRRIPTPILKSAITNMAVHGVKSIMYAGEGEPLLHPDIGEVIEWTGRNGIDVGITTNAIALTPKFLDRALVHCSWIKISCNGGSAGNYAAVHATGLGDWSKVWNNVTDALYLRDMIKWEESRPAIGVQCVLLPENVDYIYYLGRMCKSIGVDYLVIKPYSQHLKSGNTQHALIKYEEKYDRAIAEVETLANSEFEIITRRKSMESWDESGESRKNRYGKCYSTPYFWAYIMATGDVYGCSAYLEDQRFCYGNVNTQLFSEIWLGDKRKESMRYVEQELDIGECRKNCRMDKCNQYLWEVKHGKAHKNFI